MAKIPQRPPITPKIFTLNEIEPARSKLQRRIEEVKKLKTDNVPYDDQRVRTAEYNIKEAIRGIFGSNSPEFDHHQYHEIWHGGHNMGDDQYIAQRKFTAGIDQTVMMLTGLIGQIDEMSQDVAAFAASSINDTHGLRDALTQLWTKGKMDSDLEKCLANATEKKQPLSIIMIDVDHFKSVNDTHGHLKGNEVLAGIATLISAVVSGKGHAYRFGGEEIVIALMNHSTQEAIAVSERIRRTIESDVIAGLKITASFGIGTYPDHGQTLVEVIKAADTAMYDAKNLGRNLVRMFGEPPPKKDGSHEPERKLPNPGALSEQLRQEIRKQHFSGIAVRCPNDGAVLAIQEHAGIGSSTVQIIIWCKLCGLTDQF